MSVGFSSESGFCTVFVDLYWNNAVDTEKCLDEVVLLKGNYFDKHIIMMV